MTWTDIASAQERIIRGTSSRSRTPTRLVGAREGVPASTASHLQVHPGETIVDEHVVAEPLSEGEYIVDDPSAVSGGGYASSGGCGCESCGGGGCDSCSVGGEYGTCTHCNAPRRFCICFPAHGWVQAEYLAWRQSGMYLPPLVTTGTGTRDTAGVIAPGNATTILYGGSDDVLTDIRNGGRIRFGWWLDRWPGWGIEAEYVGLAQTTEDFFRSSTGATGSQILARPFTNALNGLADAELVAFPGVLQGSIQTSVTSQLNGAAFRLRKQLCCSTGCGYSELCCQTVPTSSRLDGTFGYRFWELSESLQVREDLTGLPPNPGDFDIVDRFETRNQFNGPELGFLWQGRRGWWTLDALMRVGVGNVHQTATISGQTIITQNGTATTYPNTGLLAQTTNVGTYERNKFTAIPEFGATLGYQLTRHTRLTAGYSLIYWGNVLRPGDQIDTTVNPNLLAPAINPLVGPLRPQFQFEQTDYWVHGLSFGGEFRW